MRLRTIVVMMLATLVLAGNSLAHTVKRFDADDTPGKFDIRMVSVDHADKLILTTKVTGLLTRQDFTGGNKFYWWLDTQGDSSIDFSVRLEARKSSGTLRMKCILVAEGNAPEIVGRVRGRIDGRRGICGFDRSRVGGLPEEWNVATIYEGAGDRAPDDGTTFEH